MSGSAAITLIFWISAIRKIIHKLVIRKTVGQAGIGVVPAWFVVGVFEIILMFALYTVPALISADLVSVY
jgi:hypothetical protein